MITTTAKIKCKECEDLFEFDPNPPSSNLNTILTVKLDKEIEVPMKLKCMKGHEHEYMVKMKY